MRPLTQEEFVIRSNVSRETAKKLSSYIDLLATWQPTINLVGQSTMRDPWRRHILDCHQVAKFLPQSRLTIVDIGAGAGLPGLILAMSTDHDITLVESDKRKAAFLRFAISALNLGNAKVLNRRAETLETQYGIVTARACSSIDKILTMTQSWRTSETQYILLKGTTANSELTECAKHWQIEGEIHASETDPTGSVVILKGVTSQNEPPNRI